jgi:hypothetical protein
MAYITRAHPNHRLQATRMKPRAPEPERYAAKHGEEKLK